MSQQKLIFRFLKKHQIRNEANFDSQVVMENSYKEKFSRLFAWQKKNKYNEKTKINVF